MFIDVIEALLDARARHCAFEILANYYSREKTKTTVLPNAKGVYPQHCEFKRVAACLWLRPAFSYPLCFASVWLLGLVCVCTSFSLSLSLSLSLWQSMALRNGAAGCFTRQLWLKQNGRVHLVDVRLTIV